VAPDLPVEEAVEVIIALFRKVLHETDVQIDKGPGSREFVLDLARVREAWRWDEDNP